MQEVVLANNFADVELLIGLDRYSLDRLVNCATAWTGRFDESHPFDAVYAQWLQTVMNQSIIALEKARPQVLYILLHVLGKQCTDYMGLSKLFPTVRFLGKSRAASQLRYQ